MKNVKLEKERLKKILFDGISINYKYAVMIENGKWVLSETTFNVGKIDKTDAWINVGNGKKRTPKTNPKTILNWKSTLIKR